MRKALAFIALILTTAIACNAQSSFLPQGTVLNTTFLEGPGAVHSFLIASLPPPNGSDYDHVHILATLGGWYAGSLSYIDATFGNRGFEYTWTLRGEGPVTISAAKLVAYRDTSDQSVDIYMILGDGFVEGGYSILEADEETTYPNPTDAGSSTPSGTLIFDSSSPQYPPSTYTDFAGNITAAGNVSANGVTANALTVNGSAIFSGNVTLAGRLAQFNPTPLGSTVGSTNTLLSLSNSTNDWNTLMVSEIRNAAGTNWYSATTRMQNIIDGLPQGYLDFNPMNGTSGLAFGSATTEYIRIANGGNVGIGTANPSAKFELNGNLKLTASSGASIIFADGTVQSTAYTGTCVATGGDYAESVDVVGDKSTYEPGDLIVIDPANPERFLKSSQPYSTLVAGIYSTKPGYVGRRQAGNPKLLSSEIPMAMIGIVPTKVTTENGSIKAGDMLVTSSFIWYAMKGTDHSAMSGAIVGKALNNLETGNGVIQVLVTLQ